jgi:ABC-type sulfate transport system permease component
MYGVVIAQSFVSAPFLVVVARSAFRAVDPSLGDVAATLGYGPLARFLRVDVPAASDGLRTGMILMWLRAFGEYGTTVVLAYHPYSLPVYVDNLFSSGPLSLAEAPTILAFGVAVLAVVVGRLKLPARTRRRWASTSTPPSGRSACGWRTQNAATAWRSSDRQARASRSRCGSWPGCSGRTPGP